MAIASTSSRRVPYPSMQFSVQRFLVTMCLFGVGLTACDETRVVGDGGLGDGSASDAASNDARDGSTGPDYLTRLNNDNEYVSLQGAGREVKYLLRVEGREPWVNQDCLFQNTERFAFHSQFLIGVFPELRGMINTATYAETVLRNAGRRQWGGTLVQNSILVHPVRQSAGVAGYFVYQDGNAVTENLSVAQIVEVDRRMKACVPYLADRMVFFPEGTNQVAHARTIAAELSAQNVAMMLPEARVIRSTEAYSVGEGYGTLLVVNGAVADDAYGPHDIVVSTSAPNEISLVAGFISAFPQNLHSHVNLRLREKRIPSAMLRNALSDARVTSNANQLVHLVVAEGGAVTIARATIEAAQEFWSRQRPIVGPLRSNLTVEDFRPLSGVRYADAISYGVKAANIGELGVALPAANRPTGFAIPFDAYRDFMVHNNFAAMMATVLSTPPDSRLSTDRAFRVAELDRIRNLLKNGNLPPGLLDRVRAAAIGVFGSGADTLFLRFRSSTNAEDLEGISGAGLYESASGCLADDYDSDTTGPSRCLTPAIVAHLQGERTRLSAELAANPSRTWINALVTDIDNELSEEKTVAKALRKVWRSIWNLRAFDERDYYGLAHADVYMGMAVIPRFVGEEQEAVVVTNLHPDTGLALYRVISQVRDLGVVRPVDPEAVAEVMTFRRQIDNGVSTPTEFRIDIACNRAAGALWSAQQRLTLASLLFRAQDHFQTNVYPSAQSLRLDMEIEVVAGEIVIKQARPYIGTE